MNERDITNKWRRLFDGQAIGDVSLDEAEALLKRLSSESPLRLRLETELEEIRRLRRKG